MRIVKTPFLLRKYYPSSVIWNMPRDKKNIYLTFDDGPIPEVTPWVLETLKKFDAKATFFCIGDNVQKHPSVFRQILDEGHVLGNHTFNHLKGWNTPDEEYVKNVQKCAQLVNSDLFRPPYGRIKRSQLLRLTSHISHLKIIMWDTLTWDFDRALSPEKCLEYATNNARNGSIVVFHDSLKAEKNLRYALPKALEFWKDKGYNFPVIDF